METAPVDTIYISTYILSIIYVTIILTSQLDSFVAHPNIRPVECLRPLRTGALVLFVQTIYFSLNRVCCFSTEQLKSVTACLC